METFTDFLMCKKNKRRFTFKLFHILESFLFHRVIKKNRTMSRNLRLESEKLLWVACLLLNIQNLSTLGIFPNYEIFPNTSVDLPQAAVQTQQRLSTTFTSRKIYNVLSCRTLKFSSHSVSQFVIS